MLIVEVARTSALRDRSEKATLYAQWGAQEYWVVDLGRRELVIHTEPEGDHYATVRTVTRGLVELPQAGRSIEFTDFLPLSA